MSLLGLNSPEQTAAYLRTLPAIRERCGRVHALAKAGKLDYFQYHPEKEEEVASFCAGLMQRDFSDFAQIPPHGRWRHLDAGSPRIEPLIAQWESSPSPPDKLEVTRRLLDLFLVSVLLDAGAGGAWKYRKENGQEFARSEGLGVASVHMFTQGLFSGVKGDPYRVDAKGLASLTSEHVASAMQVSDSNPMVGIEGRAGLLRKLSDALAANKEYFGEAGRPGHLVDFLARNAKPGVTPTTIDVSALWAALIEGLASIWPARHTLAGIPLGDVWPCPSLAKAPEYGGKDVDLLVPFHKLTGWTTYSLLEPLQKILGWKVEGTEYMTGLPEYRNGGLLLDLGVLSIKPGALPAEFWPDGGEKPGAIPRVPPSHPLIIEWRAMTVIELDRIADLVRKQLGLTAAQLTLAQVLESCTWKGGREIAAKKRQGGGPPIDIISDGTVF